MKVSDWPAKSIKKPPSFSNGCLLIGKSLILDSLNALFGGTNIPLKH